MTLKYQNSLLIFFSQSPFIKTDLFTDLDTLTSCFSCRPHIRVCMFLLKIRIATFVTHSMIFGAASQLVFAFLVRMSKYLITTEECSIGVYVQTYTTKIGANQFHVNYYCNFCM